MAKITISFKPKQTTKKMLKELNERARYVVVNRYGLEGDGERKTLESIGQEYGITRERVRQIENVALKAIRGSESFEEAQEIFDELKDIIMGLGGVVAEDHLFEELSSDPVTQNHIHLYLTLGEHFTKHKENNKYAARWVVDQDVAERVHKALDDLHDALENHELVSEEELIDQILNHNVLFDIHESHRKPDNARRWLHISKKLGKNPLGEWGRASSPNVRTRGVKDYAYLVMRKHGSPMHFREVAKAIEETFGKKTHTATCHNELIKDKRFVLVGRGVYALKEWGYKGGVVREVIHDILDKEGPMTKNDIVDRVLKERYLKRNTILVNLQNPKYFVKDKNGLYRLA